MSEARIEPSLENTESKEEYLGLPKALPNPPATNYDEIYAVLLHAQTMALDNYRMYLRQAHEARDIRLKSDHQAQSKMQISAQEQEYLEKAIKARDSMDMISSALQNTTLSEEQFAFGAATATSGNEVKSAELFKQSSEQMRTASGKLHDYGTKLDAEQKVENRADGSSYDQGFALGRQFVVFADSMKSFAARIAVMPVTIKKAIVEKGLSVAEAVTTSVRGFFSKASKIFNQTASAAVEGIIAANDKRGEIHEKAENIALNALQRCSDYIEVLDGKINAKYDASSEFIKSTADTLQKHGSGMGNVFGGMANVAADKAAPVLSDLGAKLKGLRQSVESKVSLAANAVADLYADGVLQAEEKQEAKRKSAP